MGCAATTVAIDSRPDSQTNLHDFEWLDDVRLVLLGKSGAGKSETGNGILADTSNCVFNFSPSFSAVTVKCQREHAKRFGAEHIYVTDTPGVLTSGSDISKRPNSEEILKCLDMNVPGPNVFLLVLRADTRFTSEDVAVLKVIEELFGEEIYRYMIIIFTRGELLEMSDRSIDEKLGEMPKEYQELYEKCRGRYVTVENPGIPFDHSEYFWKDRLRQRDIRTLFERIYQLLDDNHWSYYTARKGTSTKREE